MTYEQKSAIIISQLRADRDRLLDAFDNIRSEIQTAIDEEKTWNGNINKGVVIGLQMALEIINIIDKYKSVFEPQEIKEPECDRDTCIKNEYNGIGCDECEVTKSQEPKTGHWIPVSEMLPQKGEIVLLTICANSSFYGFNENFVKVMCGSYIPCEDKRDWIVNEIRYYIDNVIAWTPLPEPYKAESDDQK